MQASEITHYVIEVSEDVAPLKPVSTHLRIATYDLIPEVRNALITVSLMQLSILLQTADDPSTDGNVQH